LRKILSWLLSSLFQLPFYLLIFSPISILDERIALLIPFVLPQTLHLYSMLILFVALVFLFQSFAPFLDLFPRFPYPVVSPLSLFLAGEPLDIGWLADLDFCLAV